MPNRHPHHRLGVVDVQLGQLRQEVPLRAAKVALLRRRVTEQPASERPLYNLTLRDGLVRHHLQRLRPTELGAEAGQHLLTKAVQGHHGGRLKRPNRACHPLPPNLQLRCVIGLAFETQYFRELRLIHRRCIEHHAQLLQPVLKPLRKFSRRLLREGHHQGPPQLHATKHLKQHLTDEPVGLPRPGARLDHPECFRATALRLLLHASSEVSSDLVADGCLS